MLYRLVSWPVFPHSDAIVGEDPYTGVVRKASKANSWTVVIGKNKEGAPIWNNTRVKGHTINNSPHTVLPDTKMEVAAFWCIGVERGTTINPGFVRWG